MTTLPAALRIVRGAAAFFSVAKWLPRLGVALVLCLLPDQALLQAQQPAKPPPGEPEVGQEEVAAPGPIRPAHLVLLNGKIWTLAKYIPPPPPELEEGEEAPPPFKPELTEDGMWIAEAVAIRGSRIIAVGTTEEIQRMVGENFTRVINLKGRLVLPGFIDNHTHFAQAGRLLLGLNLLEVNEAVEFQRRVREASQRLPEGAWLTGGDWGAYARWEKDSTGTKQPDAEVSELSEQSEEEESAPSLPELPDREGGFVGRGADRSKQDAPQQPAAESRRPSALQPQPEEIPDTPSFAPTKALIDSVTGDRPALISHFDGEFFLANSAALLAAGIDATTPNPEDGYIFRDGNGEPNGLLKGSAAWLVEDVIPPPTVEQRKAEALRALDEARRYGVTSIHDNVADFETWELYRELQKSEELTVRVWARMRLSAWETVAEIIRSFRLPYRNGGWGDQFVRLGGLKGWVDGIMGNSTALFFEPYENDPDNSGELRDIMFPDGNLHTLVKGADGAGFAVTIHAIGDRANRILLDTYEKVIKENPERDRRFRVVHAQVIHPDDFERFGKLKLIAEVQPYHLIDDMRWMDERIGARTRNAYAFRRLKEAGALLSFGTDWPGTNASYYPINPLLGIYAAVTRRTLKGEPLIGWHPEQRISVEEAIRAYTINNAYAAFEETLKGSIKDGRVADLVVLDRDIVTILPDEIKDTRVDFTIFGGKILYDRVAEARKARRKRRTSSGQ